MGNCSGFYHITTGTRCEQSACGAGLPAPRPVDSAAVYSLQGASLATGQGRQRQALPAPATNVTTRHVWITPSTGTVQ